MTALIAEAMVAKLTTFANLAPALAKSTKPTIQL